MLETVLRPWFAIIVIVIIAVALCSFPVVASAQQSDFDADSSDAVIEEVIVTGTRIKRRDSTSPSPLTTITREDFEFSGQPTIEEYLNQMPQVQPDFGRTANSPGDGTARLNLRGLGAGRTLVLLNGRRVAPSGVGSAVDVNNLPRALLDRVEIITGGASTVYGSDAIAGVINFITREDFEGLSVDGSYNVTAEGDSDIYDMNIVFGHDFAAGRGNVTLYAGYYKRDALLAPERDLSSMVYQDTWEGDVIEWGNSVIPDGVIASPRVDLGTGRDRAAWNPDGTLRAWNSSTERYNYQEFSYLQTPLTRLSLGVMARLDVSERFEAYFEAAYTQNEASQSLAPAPYRGTVTVNTDNPVLSPETRQLFEDQLLVAPGIAGMSLRRRMLELGPRIKNQDREYTRVVVGLRGDLGGDWEMDAWVTYTDASESESLLNDGSNARLAQGLLVDPATGQCFDPSGGCVALDLFGEGRLSQEGADFIRVPALLNTTKREQILASVVFTGAPFDIWSGPVDMAFGAEWRQDDGSFKADDALFTDDTMGFRAAAPVVGTESVYELYSEAVVPIIDNLETGRYLGLELGARLSEYKNAGSVWTWKAGLQWQATDSLRFRAMLQHSVRAPSNEELFLEQFTESGILINDFRLDPCSASQDPVGNGNMDKCLIQGLDESQLGLFEADTSYPVERTFGGNPDLQPEDSDTTTVGFVFSPEAKPELMIAVDYFDLEVNDTIGEISAFEICFDPLNAGNVFCNNIGRDASGNINELFEPTSNRGVLGVEGVDTQIQYSSNLPSTFSFFDDGAQLSINTIWTHLISTTSQENVVTEIQECAGLFGMPCQNTVAGSSFPENRVTSNIDYASGPLNIHLTWRWIDGMDNAAPLYSAVFGFPDPDLGVPNVPSYSFFDLGLGYRFGEKFHARFGINNLTDEKAPQMADTVFANNTDTRLYDLFGRTFYLSFAWNSQ